MNTNVVGEEFEPYVVEQIKTRQKAQYLGKNALRSNDELQYLNNRNAWVKLASSIEVLPNTAGVEKVTNLGFDSSWHGTRLAEKAVLFNSLSSYTDSSSPLNFQRANISNNTSLWNDEFLYGIGGTEFGILPPPGIIEATVDSLNRGSIRKAAVTLKAHNRFQFDIIELLYLRLGFTMMLEWGWDRYLSRNNKIEKVLNTIIEEKWFTSKGISQLQMLTHIEDMREKYEGNVDAFFGKVSNFTWNFNPDGTYDINIDLITVGDVIESIKTNVFSKNGFATGEGSGVEISEEVLTLSGLKYSLGVKDTNIAKAASTTAVGFYFYKIIADASANIDQEGKPRWYATKSSDTARISATGDQSEETDYIKIIPDADSGLGAQYYVRFGEFLAQLESIVVPLISNDGSTQEPQLSISYTVDDNLISFFPNQVSLDPKICILRPQINTYGDIKGITYPPQFDHLNGYVTYNNTFEAFGKLMNIYMNLEFIAGLLVTNGNPNEEISLFKLLQGLCDGINNALGGVNKLEPIIKKDRTVVIVDQTLSANEPPTVDLEVYGYNDKEPISNFVKDIKFVSKITPKLASMVSIGATAAGSSTSEIDGTAFSKWSEGLMDRFSQEILESQALDQYTPTETDKAQYLEKWEKYPDAGGSQYPIVRWWNRTFGNYTDPKIKRKRITYGRGYDSIYGLELSFEEFYKVASVIDRANGRKSVIKPQDIKNIVPKNYSVWLATAFGGTVENLFIEDMRVYQVGLGGSNKGRGARESVTEYTKKSVIVGPNQTQYFKYNDTYITQGKAAYKNYLNVLNNDRYEKKEIPSTEVGFIPLSFELTLEGISGIKIYNKLNINSRFLPTNYPKTLGFIITKVNHIISNNNWDTSLSTVSIPKSKPYIFDTTITQQSSGETENTTTTDFTGTGFDPGNLFTNNGRSTNAWKLISDPQIPVENGFLHRYPGMLAEADETLYSRLSGVSAGGTKFRLFYGAMPHFMNLLNAYEKAVSTDGKTFLEKYGKLQVVSSYRAIQNTPVGPAATYPGNSMHGLGIAVDLQQPASHAEVHEWFKANAPGLGWMRLPLLSNGTNETWHWELQYDGPYAKLDKATYAIASNIKNNGRNGSIQYQGSDFRNATGVEKLNPKYVIDAKNPSEDGTRNIWGAQIVAQTLPPL